MEIVIKRYCVVDERGMLLDGGEGPGKVLWMIRAHSEQP